MTVYSNQPVHIQKQQSSYPFDKKSSLLFQQSVFPTHLIKSCILNVTEAVFPVYVSEFQLEDGKVYMRLSDSSQPIGYVLIKENKPLCQIRANDMTVLGSMQADTKLYEFLQSRLKNMARFTYTCTAGDFIISSECINCCWVNGFRVLNVDGFIFKNSVTLDFRNNAAYDPNANTISVFGDLQSSSVTSSKLVFVNGKDLRNKGLVIKHKMLSDVRVVSKQSKVTFTSVTDA